MNLKATRSFWETQNWQGWKCSYRFTERYRFGFNGKEKDDDVKGSGNSYDYGARIYDPRLGRWCSVDPSAKKYPGITPFNYSYNSPVIFHDPDGKDGRLSVQGNTITLETTVHVYGPDAAAFIAQNKGYSSTGTVKIDGQAYTTVINVKYVMNEQLTKAAEGMNNNFSQTQPEASSFKGVGVKEGDNMLYVDKDFKMKNEDVKGMTTQGGSNARINDFSAAKNETMNMLGFSDRYGTDGDGFSFPDKGFENDYASNNPQANTISPVHLFDATSFGLQKSGGTNATLPYTKTLIDNLGTGKNHKAESDDSVQKKTDAVSGQH